MPWVATAYENGSVVIWNYKEHLVSFSFSLNEYEQKKRERYAMQRHLEQLDTNGNAHTSVFSTASGNNASSSANSSDKKPPTIHHVAFCDGDTAASKFAYSSPGHKIVPWSRTRSGLILRTMPHDILLCIDHAVLFVNYRTGNVREVLYEEEFNMEQKVILTCATMIPNYPFLAFGGSDGVVRLWNYATWTLQRVMVNGHSKRVTDLSVVVEGINCSLLSVGADGWLCTWNINIANIEAPPIVIKCGGELHGLSHDPLNHTLSMFSQGSKLIYRADAIKHLPMSRIKCGAKKVYFTSCSAFPHPSFPSGSLLVTAKDSSRLMVVGAIDEKHSWLRELCDTSMFGDMVEPIAWKDSGESMHDPSESMKQLRMAINDQDEGKSKFVGFGSSDLREFQEKNKKKGGLGLDLPKDTNSAPATPTTTSSSSQHVWQMVHPLLPWIIVVIHESTMYILEYDASSTPTFAHRNGIIYTSPKDQILETPLEGSPWVAYYPLKELLSTSSLRLSFAPSGQYLAVRWLDHTHRYQVLDVTTWTVVDDGYAASLVWSPTEDKYAVLEVEHTKAEKGDDRSSAIVPPVSPRVRQKARIMIKEAWGRTSPYLIEDIPTPFPPDQLWAGPLIGISYGTGNSPEELVMSSRHGNSIDQVGSPHMRRAAGFSWLDWGTGDMCSPLLPRPLYVSWSPDASHCLLAGETYSTLLRVGDTFKVLATYPMAMTSALWWNETLIYATPEEIGCISPRAASFGTTTICASPKMSNLYVLFEEMWHESLQFSNQPRPYGSLSLVSVQGDSLYVLDAGGSMHQIELSHPFLRALFLASAGKFTEAMTWLPSLLHGEMRLMLATYFCHADQGDLALKEMELNPSDAIQLCITFSLWSTGERLCRMRLDGASVDTPLIPRPLAVAFAHAASKASACRAASVAFELSGMYMEAGLELVRAGAKSKEIAALHTRSGLVAGDAYTRRMLAPFLSTTEEIESALDPATRAMWRGASQKSLQKWNEELARDDVGLTVKTTSAVDN